MLTRRFFLTKAGLGAIGLASALGLERASASPPSLSADRLRGMITLGAYGDALGAWHEAHGGLNGRSGDPDRTQLRGSDRADAHPWGYWHTAPDGPTVTDDTAFRLHILHPFLRACLARGLPPDEANLLRWMRQLPSAPDAPLDRLRAAQSRDWLAMHRAAQARRAHLFYTPDEPVVFGPYIWLEAGALWAHLPPLDVYQRFRAQCSLDQGPGQALTGLLAALIATAHADPDTPPLGSFAGWLTERSEALLSAAAHDRGDLDAAQLLRHGLHASHLARAKRGIPPQTFTASMRDALYSDPRFAARHQHAYLSALFWAQMSAAAAFAHRDDALMLRTLAASAGDSDTMASMIGGLMGARYGRRACGAIEGLDGPLEPDLQRVEDALEADHGAPLSPRVTTFQRLAQALRRSAPPTPAGVNDRAR